MNSSDLQSNNNSGTSAPDKKNVSGKKHLALLPVILLGIIITGIGLYLLLSPQAEPEPELVLYYAENQTADYPTTLGGQMFASLVEERTNGRIRILVKYNGELGRELEVLEQMQYGGIAFSRVSLTQLAEFIPELSVLQMPYLYTDSAHMWRTLEGEIGDFFLGKTSEHDIIGLSWYDAGARNFYSSNKPIVSLSDFQGMTIRVQESDMMVDMVEALGATAVKIPYSEVYSQLEQKKVDGAENNWPSYDAMKHYEVAPYYTIDEHTRIPEMQICSRVIWNKLSKTDKDIIMECARESALYERELWKLREEEARMRLEESGITVITLSNAEKRSFRDAMSEIYQKYSGDYMDIIEKILADGK